MATEPEPVSSDPSTVLEQVEKESNEHVKTIEKKPIADDESPPGLDVTSSGPDETADVSDKESWNNDHVVAEVDKGDVSGGTDGDGIKNDAVNMDLEEESKREVAESEAEVNKTKPEEIPEDNIEPSESLDDAVGKVEDSSEKIEVPESVHEVVSDIDVGKKEDLSEEEEEEKAHVIEELEKESSQPDKIEVDAAKDKESSTESGLEPIGIEKPKQDGITTTEELAHTEQRDRDFPPESESVKGISDFAETEQKSREIEQPADLEGDSKDETLSTVDKDIEVEKKVDAEEPHKSVTGTGGGEDRSEEIAEEVKESAGVEADEKTDVDAAKDEEETNKTELPVQSGTEVNEAKGEVAAKENLEEIEPSSESLDDDVAKESSEKIEILESMPEASNVESEQSEEAVMITEAKDLGNSAAKQVKNEDDLSDEKDEITKELNKESAETDAADKVEIDAAKDKESQANNKVKGFESKSESVAPEPPIATDEPNDTEKLVMDMENEDNKKEDTVLEAKGKNTDDVSEAEQTSRDIELPTDIIEGKNDKDIEVEKKIDAEESLESETTTGTKREDLSDENAEITKESKETEKTDIDAAKDEQFLTKEVEEPVASQSSKQNNINTEDTHVEHIDTELAPTSEAEQNIDTEDPIKTEDENNSIETSAATDAEDEETPEAQKTKEETFSLLPTTTQDSDDVSKVDQTSRDVQLPADLESNKGESLATIEKSQESKTGTIEEEEEENVKLDAPIAESDDVKTTEEAPKEEEVAPVKQKQSNNLLSKVKQSLVKAKKAIIKKAPSKTPPTS